MAPKKSVARRAVASPASRALGASAVASVDLATDPDADMEVDDNIFGSPPEIDVRM